MGEVAVGECRGGGEVEGEVKPEVQVCRHTHTDTDTQTHTHTHLKDSGTALR